MKYIKLFESFQDWTKDYDIDFDDVKEIFLSVGDYGLIVEDAHMGSMMSMGDNSIIEDHNEFDMSNIIKGLSVRLRFNRDIDKNNNFQFTDEFYNELELTIEHFESRYGCELSNIFISKNKDVWVKDIDTMKEYINSLSEASISWISFIDVAFEIK